MADVCLAFITKYRGKQIKMQYCMRFVNILLGSIFFVQNEKFLTMQVRFDPIYENWRLDHMTSENKIKCESLIRHTFYGKLLTCIESYLLRI